MPRKTVQHIPRKKRLNANDLTRLIRKKKYGALVAYNFANFVRPCNGWYAYFVDLYNSHHSRSRKKGTGDEPQLPKKQRKKRRQSEPTPKPKRQRSKPNTLLFIAMILVAIISLKNKSGELPSQSKSQTTEKSNNMTREEFLATVGTVQAEPQNKDYFPDDMPEAEKELRRELERYNFSFTNQLELLIKAVLRIGDVPLHTACGQYWGTKKYLQCKQVLKLKAKMFEIQHKPTSIGSVKAFINGIEKAIERSKI